MSQSGGGGGEGVKTHFFSVTLYNFQKVALSFDVFAPIKLMVRCQSG